MWAADKHGLPASLSAVPYPLRRSIRNRQSIPPTALSKQDIPTMIRPALLKMPAVHIKSKITGGPGAGLGYAGLLVLVSSG